MPVAGKTFLGEALFTVREEFETVGPDRRTWPSFVGCAPALQMQELRNIVRAAIKPLTAASARKGFPSEFRNYLSDALAD